MDRFIPLSVPNFSGKELEYVTHAIETEWVSTGGSYIDEFEKKIANYVGAKGAVGCQNGTSGLHTALMVCGVSMEDEVIVPALTFIAAVNPVKYAGAEPVFMDCTDSLCIDAEKLRKFCENECCLIDGKLINNATKKHIKALIVVHVFGEMADMKEIMDVASEFHITVIEDATEALGSYYTVGAYKGKHAGTIGNIGVYSFNGNKIITTGGGGMIVSDNEEYLQKSKHLTTQAKADQLYFIHDQIGYNYRMTNLQAGLGLAQLAQLETFIETKQKNYNRYMDNGINLLPFREDVRSNRWFYSYITDHRDELLQYLEERRIQARPVWYLIHKLAPYQNNQAYCIEKATYYWERIVNLPCSTNMSMDDVDRVSTAIQSFDLEDK